MRTPKISETRRAGQPRHDASDGQPSVAQRRRRRRVLRMNMGDQQLDTLRARNSSRVCGAPPVKAVKTLVVQEGHHVVRVLDAQRIQPQTGRPER